MRLQEWRRKQFLTMKKEWVTDHMCTSPRHSSSIRTAGDCNFSHWFGRFFEASIVLGVWVQKSCWKRERNVILQPLCSSKCHHHRQPGEALGYTWNTSALEPWHLLVPLLHTQDIDKAECGGSFSPAAPSSSISSWSTPHDYQTLYTHIHLWTYIYIYVCRLSTWFASVHKYYSQDLQFSAFSHCWAKPKFSITHSQVS